MFSNMQDSSRRNQAEHRSRAHRVRTYMQELTASKGCPDVLDVFSEVWQRLE